MTSTSHPSPPTRYGSVALSLCTTTHPLYIPELLTYSVPLFLKRKCARRQVELQSATTTPHPGWSQMDPMAIVSSVEQSAAGALEQERNIHRVGTNFGPTLRLQ